MFRFRPWRARHAWPRALSGWGKPDISHQQRQKPVVDSKLVNVHHCVLESKDDRNTLEVLRLVRRGLRLLDKGGDYAGARRLFAEGVTKTDCDRTPDAVGPAAWVACNAMGISLMLGAQHEEADAMLGQAQRCCQHLTEQGLVNDAFTDVAGVLCDRAANLIQIGQEDSISKAVTMLKRARFMAERAYRPNHLLLDSLSTNLATALTLTGEFEQAHTLVKGSVKMGDTLEALKAGVRNQGSSPVRSDSEILGHSRSLALDAAILVKTGAVESSLLSANRAWDAAASLQAGALDSARLYMCLASVHWLAARQLPGTKAKLEMGNALSRLEAARSILSAKQGGAKVRQSHPDAVVCNVNRMVLRRSMFYIDAMSPAIPAKGCSNFEAKAANKRWPDSEQQVFREEKARCLAAIRVLSARLGSENTLIQRLKQSIAEAKKLPSAACKAAATAECPPLPRPVELPVISFRVGLDDVIECLRTHGSGRKRTHQRGRATTRSNETAGGS